MAGNILMNRRTPHVYWLLLFAPSIFIIIVVVFPYLNLLSSNLNSALFSQVFGNSVTAQLTRKAIENSLSQGLASAATSFVIGLPLGLFLGAFDFRFKRLVSSVVIVPFFLPSILVVFSFITGLGPGSTLSSMIPFLSRFSTGFSGIVAVNTFFNAPLVALFTMNAVEQSDRSMDEAARTLGTGGWKRFVSIWGREGIFAALGGALLAFTYSFAGFAAPLIIGGPGSFTIDAWIYSFFRSFGDFSGAVAMAIIESLILLIPTLLFIFVTSKRSRVVSSSSMGPVGSGNRYFYAGVLYAALWIFFELYMLSSVIFKSLGSVSALSVKNYETLFQEIVTSKLGISTFSAMTNSMFYGLCTALLVATLGLIWAIGKRRLGISSAPGSEIFQYVPLVVSSILMAFSIYIVIESLTPLSLIWVLIIFAQTAVAIPIVLRVIDTGFSSLPRSLSEASMTLRGNPFFDVELPLARSTFATALVFGFGISLGEFSATNFLATSNYIPLAVEIYDLQNLRLFGPAYAAAGILLIVSVISFYFIMRIGGRFAAVR